MTLTGTETEGLGLGLDLDLQRGLNTPSYPTDLLRREKLRVSGQEEEGAGAVWLRSPPVGVGWGGGGQTVLGGQGPPLLFPLREGVVLALLQADRGEEGGP